MSKRIIRPRETQAKLGIGRSKFWSDVKSGKLPPLIRLGPKSVGHLEDDIDQFIESLRARNAPPQSAA